ncbi:MAG: hypothetical protein MZV70_47870 [Desulfobacterales bacterium]|nr:hypothetical protein [Desulfobacterales bacterium]
MSVMPAPQWCLTLIFRHLKARGYDVTYVKNFTDIDDKIIDRANKEGVGIAQIAERYIKLHDEDMAALNVLTPTVTPKATEHMADMIALISTLENKGIAYCSGRRCVFCGQQLSRLRWIVGTSSG